VPAPEVLAHRILWSTLLLGALLLWRRGTRDGGMAWRLGAVSGVLLATNWLIYVWAVQTDRVLEASLGYFIQPLVSVALAMLFLGERLNRFQALAVLLATGGVLTELLALGSLPWIALALAFSFGGYGLVRKKWLRDPVQGLFTETAVLSPLALFWLLMLGFRGQASFLGGNQGTDLLLVAAGAVTVAPLLLFLRAMGGLRLSTVGLIQYLTPTLQFLLAVFLYGESFGPVRLISFGFIWAGLAVYTLDAFRRQQRPRARAGRRLRN
jgi:chloramphenicol-sensitive protein RarD